MGDLLELTFNYWADSIINNSYQNSETYNCYVYRNSEMRKSYTVKGLIDIEIKKLLMYGTNISWTN